MRSRILLAPALLALAATSYAFIFPAAVSSSHELQNAATALHDYMHETYPSSYGAHGLETESTALHATLHEWEDGNASECDVISQRGTVKDTFVDTFYQFLFNGIFVDQEATDMFFGTFGNYLEVWLYTLFARC